MEPKTVQDQKQGSYSTSKTFAKSREITANTQPNNYYMSKSTQKISMSTQQFSLNDINDHLCTYHLSKEN